jgi:phosphoribosyl 1,2-cyclic phosphodiesterase
MVEFTTLASSSEGCAYLLSGGGASAPLLIDCGLPFKALQKALNYKVSSIAGCLISHSHQDHCKAAKELSNAGIDCYASKETWRLISEKQAINKHRCYELHRAPLDSGINTVGDWLVFAFDAKHDCEGTLGFIIWSKQGDKVLYLTDSCYSKYRFKNLTRICIECNHSMEIMKANTLAGTIDKSRYSRTAHNHMSLERLIEMLKANDLSKVERITLLHLSDANSDEVAFKDAVQRATGIPTEIAAKGR